MCETCGRELHHPFAPSRRKFVLGAAAIGLAFAGKADAKGKRKEKEDDEKEKKKPPKPENVISPDASLKRLMDGDARYVDGVRAATISSVSAKRYPAGDPYAAILSCADSRIAPEYAFDTARGDCFVCRIAGNFASDEMVASLDMQSPCWMCPDPGARSRCLRRGRCHHQIAERQQHAAGPFALAGHSDCARRKGSLPARGRYACECHPPERHR